MEKSEFIDQLYRSFEEHECAELLQGNGADTLYELSAELMRTEQRARARKNQSFFVRRCLNRPIFRQSCMMSV